MNTYKVVQDSKREEFRKYLEKNGVMDVLTRCLVSLYEEPEKPADALQYVRNTLGAASPDKVELESLRLVVAEMKEKMTVMEEENKELRERLAGLTVDADTADGAEEGDTAAADSTAADAKEKK
ncbi:c-Myc-binding protein-like [Amphibalanus amphitrite]|uniref:c-Myc-binding protein-like n=1 Tax=Amphibalanus amphitrite TaxID=1232801 RepID=UPI001C920B40|nr:c-Myc-binding protein-like [Amphibalanus amphitrite]